MRTPGCGLMNYTLLISGGNTFDFGSHRELGRMFLIHEPELAVLGPERSDFLRRFGSRHYRCDLHSLQNST